MGTVPIDPDAPWQVNAVITLLIAAAALLMLWRAVRREIRQAAADTKAAREAAEHAASQLSRNGGSSALDRIEQTHTLASAALRASERNAGAIDALRRDVGHLTADLTRVEDAVTTPGYTPGLDD